MTESSFTRIMTTPQCREGVEWARTRINSFSAAGQKEGKGWKRRLHRFARTTRRRTKRHQKSAKTPATLIIVWRWVGGLPPQQCNGLVSPSTMQPPPPCCTTTIEPERTPVVNNPQQYVPPLNTHLCNKRSRCPYTPAQAPIIWVLAWAWMWTQQNSTKRLL